MKRVSISRLVDDGLLFEINRQVLHPLGMALAVVVDSSNQSTPESVVLLETDDAEGVLFDESNFIDGASKFSNYFKKAGEDRVSKRYETLGYIRQSRSDQ